MVIQSDLTYKYRYTYIICMRVLWWLSQLAGVHLLSALRYQGSFTDPALECAHCHGKNVKGLTNLGLAGRIARRNKAKGLKALLRDSSEKKGNPSLRGRLNQRDVDLAAAREEMLSLQQKTGGLDDKAARRYLTAKKKSKAVKEGGKSNKSGKNSRSYDSQEPRRGAVAQEYQPAVSQTAQKLPAQPPDAKVTSARSKPKPKGKAGKKGKRQNQGDAVDVLPIPPPCPANSNTQAAGVEPAPLGSVSKLGPKGKGGKKGKKKDADNGVAPSQAIVEKEIQPAQPGSKSMSRPLGKGRRKGKKQKGTTSAAQEGSNEMISTVPIEQLKPRPKGKGGKKGKWNANKVVQPLAPPQPCTPVADEMATPAEPPGGKLKARPWAKRSKKGKRASDSMNAADVPPATVEVDILNQVTQDFDPSNKRPKDKRSGKRPPVNAELLLEVESELPVGSDLEGSDIAISRHQNVEGHKIPSKEGAALAEQELQDSSAQKESLLHNKAKGTKLKKSIWNSILGLIS